MNIKRGCVCLAALDPTVGNEISKTRPVIVISNDQNNQFSTTITVLPVTSARLDKIYPFEVFLPTGEANLPKDSKVKSDQVRTLDRSRFLKTIGELSKDKVMEIEKALRIHLAL
jgi:mRNA interferase MazF